MAGAASALRSGRGLAIVAAGVALAALVVGSGLDRAALADPALAPMVPVPFASRAIRSNALTALEAGKDQAALRLAEAAVADNPLEPTSTALLGAARDAAGLSDSAEAAFKVAGKLGWRVSLTQAYWMQRALEVGDYRVAALRLDALLRQQPGLLARQVLLDPVEQVPEGRAALVERLKERPRWLERYAGNVYDAPEAVVRQRGEVLAELAAAGTRLGCAAIGPMATQLTRVGAVNEAFALWRAHCPSGGRGLVSDPGFAALRIDKPLSPFDWEVVGNSGTSVSPEPSLAGEGRSLEIESTETITLSVLRQRLVLAPGSYRLSWRAQSAEGRPTDKILAALGCTPETPDWVRPSWDGAAGLWRAEVTVSGQCAGPTLSFGIAPNASGLRLDKVLLERR